MSLNIKNKEAHKLANQLAKLTGENMTEAVTNAVRERLDRVRCQRGSGLADRLIRIGKDCAARDRKSTRLNSSHVSISYAVFCLKKKKKTALSAAPSRPSQS